MKRKNLLIVGILIVLVALNYNFLDAKLTSWIIENSGEYEEGIVSRVVDGDTIVINNEKIRMLGMNSPEKGEKYSLEAQEFLESNILNKSVKIYFGKEKYDRYDRKLGYIFYKCRNINAESVKLGLSNYYFPSGKDDYYQHFYNSWDNCLENGKNLCEKSVDKCANCIEVDWNYKNELVVLENVCSFNCDLNGWSVKDEGRKKYFISEVLSPGKSLRITEEDFGKTYVWTNTGDSIFIRDSEEKLVYFDSY